MQPVILPLSYFPNIFWYAVFLNQENISLELNEHFVKQSYRNRMEIYGPNGILSLIVPIQRSQSPRIPIKEIKISNADNWQKIHWSSLESAYRRSAYFEFYEPYLKPIFKKEWGMLVDLNLEVLKVLNGLMKVDKKFDISKEYIDIKEGENYRKSIHPKTRTAVTMKAYYQLFAEKYGFLSNLSILDVLFTKGPDSREFIKNIQK